MDISPSDTKLALAYLTLSQQRPDSKISVRALRDQAKVSTAAAAQYLRTLDSTADYNLSGLDTQAVLSTLLESIAVEARVAARAEIRPALDAARESEAHALEQIEELTEKVRQAELQAASDAATIALLRETRDGATP